MANTDGCDEDGDVTDSLMPSVRVRTWDPILGHLKFFMFAKMNHNFICRAGQVHTLCY